MAWSAITNPEIDPDSPITTALKTKFRDNNVVMYDGFSFAKKAVLEGPLASAVLQDDDDLKLTMAINQLWHVEIVLIVSTSAAGADFKFNFTEPANCTWMMQYIGYEVNGIIETLFLIEGGADGQMNYAGAAVGESVVMRGWVETTDTAGDFQLQWARLGGAGTATVGARSYLVAHQDYATI